VSARAWEAILAAWSDTDGLVQTTLPSGAGDGDARLEARLGKLREDLSTRLLGQLIPRLRSILTEEARQQLGLAADAREARLDAAEASALTARGVDDEVKQVIVPLAVHLDERVLGRLPPRFGPVWSRLQEDVIQSDDGGVKFYQNLDELLALPQASTLVLEVYLFCLCEGFFGRYIDEPERIAAYKDRIARRLPAPLAAPGKGAVSASIAPRASPRVLPAPVYYAVAVTAALLLILLLRALAR
jgi:type IV/VI secretion system ImpK/VasF family protein